MTPAWALEGVGVAYRAWGRAPCVAVHDAQLTVARGEQVGLVGPSGCGKTSLVRAGLGLVPHSGTVRLFGHDTSTWSSARWRAARSDVQLMVQDPSAMLHPHATLRHLLEDSAGLHRPDAEPSAVATELLEAVGLAHRAHARVHELSGGERRRAGLARVLTARPRLLVADEPTAGLDAGLRRDLLRLVRERVGGDCAIVWVGHDLQALAAVCDRLVVMGAGRTLEALEAPALRDGTARPRHAATRHLLDAAGWQPTETRP